MKRALPFVIIAAVLVSALLTAWYFTRPTPIPGVLTLTVPANNPSPPVSSAPSPVASATDAEDDAGAMPPHQKGDPNARVTLEEFGDFQCPPCGVFHSIVKTMEAEFGPRLRVVFREFPLVPAHVHALEAARAAEAAGLQGKFWEMHHMLYENQVAWDKSPDAGPIFESYATRIGLNIEKWKRDMDGEVVERRIFLDGKRAHSLGVKGTPTVFLNGREVPFQSLPPETLRPLIQAELDRNR